jgi:Xaa-Pro aminopeptidase
MKSRARSRPSWPAATRPSRKFSPGSPRARPSTAGKSIAPAATSLQAGFGKQFIHRTGHSLGEEVHGNGVHMDDYETHDDRRLVTGTGFTIEPGVYTPTFGVRTEINMVVGERSAEVTGSCQQTLVRIPTRN